MEFIYVIIVVFAVAVLQRLLYRKSAFKNFSYSCAFDKEEVSEGEELKLVETVSNGKILPLPWLRSEITTSKWLEYAGSQAVESDETRYVSSFFLMKSFHRTVRSWNVRAMKRGVYSIDKCVLLSTDLLGMGDVSKPIATDTQVTVLPKPANLTDELFSAKKMSGEVLVNRHYIEDPFYTAGVREYTERDSMNRIHWMATAKLGKLMVRNRLFTIDQNLMVILNMQSRPYEGGKVIDKVQIEHAIRICAGYFDDTLRTGVPVRFVTNARINRDEEYVVTNEYYGSEHVTDLMRVLARLPLVSTEVFSSFLDNVCRLYDASDIVIVTAYLSDEIYEFAREKKQRGSRVKIVCASSISHLQLPADLDIFGVAGEEELWQ